MCIQQLIILISAMFSFSSLFAETQDSNSKTAHMHYDANGNIKVSANDTLFQDTQGAIQSQEQNQPISDKAASETIIYPSNPLVQNPDAAPAQVVTPIAPLVQENANDIQQPAADNIVDATAQNNTPNPSVPPETSIEWVDEKNIERPSLSDYSNYQDINHDANIISDEPQPVDPNNTTPEEAQTGTEDTTAWFSGSAEPEILKKRDKKTKFGKHDRYYGKHLCDNGMYTCIALKKSDTWQGLFPDRYQRELVQRINRTNQALWNRSWILVPNDINRDYMDFSPLPNYWDNDGSKTIVIDVSELAFAAYDEDGDMVYWGPVNPGREASQTVHGKNFQVYRKGGADCWSKKFEAKIPYCMFFHGGYAIHGFSMPGYAASHGCVRVYTDDALWLNKNFVDFKTKVIVQK